MTAALPTWSLASVPYFVYIAAGAWWMTGLPRRSRLRASGMAALGLLLALSAAYFPSFWLRGLVLPPAVLLLAYHASGCLWRGPMFGVERMLAAVDAALQIPRLARRTPRAIAQYLELSYAGVYVVIPLALAAMLAWSPTPDVDRFWTVILVTDYVCFGMLPLIQTRPPRLLEGSVPWDTRLRALNLSLLNHASIGMNTVPSGHAAEALAAALLVLDAPGAVVVTMFVAAASISTAAVLGRYHYAMDALAGWLAALAVWAVFR